MSNIRQEDSYIFQIYQSNKWALAKAPRSSHSNLYKKKHIKRHTWTMNSPSWSFWKPPTFTSSATLSYWNNTAIIVLRVTGKLHCNEIRKWCNKLNYTSLSARPYRAKAALCCKDPFFDSRSLSNGPMPPLWAMPAWLCIS